MPKKSRPVVRCLSGLLFAAVLVCPLGFAASAGAQTFTVLNLTDSGVSGDGSLRGEIRAANAREGADTVAFAAGLSGQITLSGSGLVIQGPTALEGPGSGALTVRQVSGGHRVIQVKLTEPGAVSISGLTLAGGETTGPGGDLEFDGEGEPGTLTVQSCVVTEGSAADYGGGISSFGAPLTLRDSKVIENEGDSGGGIWAGGHDMPFTIEGSTIADNEATAAAGGLNGEVEHGGHDSIVGSTFSGNKSEDFGGGAFFSMGSETSITIANTTFAENIASEGGGGLVMDTQEGVQGTIEDSTIVGNHGGSLLGEAGGLQGSGAVPQLLIDTIVADNTGAQPDIFGEWAASFSLIGDLSGAKVTEAVPASNLVGVEPQLLPLASNGGPTETMALRPASPAVNEGGGTLTTDQRGGGRPVLYPGVGLSTASGANGADIGAYELQAPPVVVQIAPPPPPPPPSAPAPGSSAPQVKVSCPPSAKPGGCRFALQVFSAKPRKPHGKGKSGRAKPPVAESAVAKAKVAPGKSALVTLHSKPKFATRLASVRSLLVRDAVTVKGSTRIDYRRLKVVGR